MLIVHYDGDRTALMPLFRLADDSEQEIAAYRDQGTILVARSDDDVIGYVQITDTDEPGTCEIKSMAVRETHQGQGVGSSLIRPAVELCKEKGARRVIVATATAGTANLRFYQLAGFRFAAIVRDAFSTARGYPGGVMIDGIALQDQIILDQVIGE